MARRMSRGSCRRDQLIEGCVEPLVDSLLIRIRVKPAEDLASADGKGNRADELRHQSLDLAVVETTEWDLSPSSEGPTSGAAAAMVSEAMCTNWGAGAPAAWAKIS